MRRYLLVLVTIAVVLSLALVGCVGQPQQPEQPPSEETPTTPPAYTPNPANGSKFLLGGKVTIDWTGWDPGFKPQIFKLYYATGTCTKPGTWTEIKIEKDPCCPIETKKTITVNECGVYWWKVWACGDDASATVGPFWFCVVPGFVVNVTTPEGTSIKSVTVQPGKEELNLEIDVCKLTDPASIVISATPTLCATTTLKVEITKPATPFFDLGLGDATGTTFSATLTSTSPSATVTLDASGTVCSSMFGEIIATVTLTVFPDEVEQCATVTHCCKTVYKVNITLKGEAPSLELWSSCTDCGGPCECGWLVLKMPKCFTLAATGTARIPDATVTIYDGTRFIEIGVAELESATHTDHKIIGNYRYYFWCLDGMDPVGIQKITEGKSYNIKVNKGAFKFINSASPAVTFGWPCDDATETVTAK